MPGEVFPFFPNDLAEPFLYPGVVYVIIVNPIFIAGVVWGIDVDELDLAFVLGEESLEGEEVVPLDDEVFFGGGLCAMGVLRG
jgi:hypothetical protein